MHRCYRPFTVPSSCRDIVGVYFFLYAMFLGTLVRKDEAMVAVLSIDDAIQNVVCETLERAGHADVEAHNGLETFAALRRETQ